MSGGKEGKKGGTLSVPTSCLRWGTPRVYSLKEALANQLGGGWFHRQPLPSFYLEKLCSDHFCFLLPSGWDEGMSHECTFCFRHRASSWLQPYWLQGVWDSGGTCVTLARTVSFDSQKKSSEAAKAAVISCSVSACCVWWSRSQRSGCACRAPCVEPARG